MKWKTLEIDRSRGIGVMRLECPKCGEKKWAWLEFEMAWRLCESCGWAGNAMGLHKGRREEDQK